MPPFAFDAQRYPPSPGCYLIKDPEAAVLYVGKAKNVRRRLASYFRPQSTARGLAQLLAELADIEIILTTNETEALILENNLIKRYQPLYNRMLLDEDDG